LHATLHPPQPVQRCRSMSIASFFPDREDLSAMARLGRIAAAAAAPHIEPAKRKSARLET